MTEVPAEAAEIRQWKTYVLGGGSLRALVRDLNERGVKPVKGGTWRDTRTVKQILTSWRMVGHATYKGEDAGRAEGWPQFMTEAEHRAIRALLEDPSRRTAFTNVPRHLVSLIATCSVCGAGLTAVSRRMKDGLVSRYTCRAAGHVTRRADELDAWVTYQVIDRQRSQLRFRSIEGGIDTDALECERTELQARKRRLAERWAAGEVDDDEQATASKAIKERLAVVEGKLARAEHVPSPADVVSGLNAAEAWQALDSEQQRAVVKELVASLVVEPAGRGTRGRDVGAGVTLTWKGEEEQEDGEAIAA